MIHLVAYSGGLSSFETARLLVEQHGASSIQCIFTDTASEDQDLYRFLKETIAYLKCDFVHLADGRDIWQVFNDVGYMGNTRVDPCSRVLKREMFRTWLVKTHPNSTMVTLYYGIQEHEKHRIDTIRLRWAPYAVEAPLITRGTTKEDMLATLDKLGILPPRLYDLGFEHNNCGGFCVKAGQRQFLHLLTVLPERYAYHEEQQEKLFEKIGQYGFIRKTVDGELAYLSLKDFRLMIQKGEKAQMFQDGACACFA